jgi:hypothetical protein
VIPATAASLPSTGVARQSGDPGAGGVALPDHDYLVTCYRYTNGQYAIVGGPAKFGSWPGANQTLITMAGWSPTGGFGTGTARANDGQMLFFGLTAAWRPANAPNTWALSGSYHNHNYSWMRGFNNIISFETQEWANGGWQRIPADRAFQVSAIVPGPGTYLAGGTFYWGPVASLGFKGYSHTEYKWQITCR